VRTTCSCPSSTARADRAEAHHRGARHGRRRRPPSMGG
jgi:hypothetical protein